MNWLRIAVCRSPHHHLQVARRARLAGHGERLLPGLPLLPRYPAAYGITAAMKPINWFYPQYRYPLRRNVGA